MSFGEILKWATRAAAAPGIIGGVAPAGSAVGDAYGSLGKSLGPVGIGLNLLGAGLGVSNAAEGFMNDDADAGWDGVGQATNGAVGAVAGATGYGPLFAGARMLTDATGFAAGEIGGDDAAFNSNELVGGHLRGLFGDESVGDDVADALGGGFFGHAVGTVANLTPLGATVNFGDNVAGGVVNTLGNMFDSDESSEDDYWGDAVSDTASDVWDWIAD